MSHFYILSIIYSSRITSHHKYFTEYSQALLAAALRAAKEQWAKATVLMPVLYCILYGLREKTDYLRHWERGSVLLDSRSSYLNKSYRLAVIVYIDRRVTQYFEYIFPGFKAYLILAWNSLHHKSKNTTSRENSMRSICDSVLAIYIEYACRIILMQRANSSSILVKSANLKAKFFYNGNSIDSSVNRKHQLYFGHFFFIEIANEIS